MKTILEVKEGELVLARYIPSCAAWEGGLKFFSGDDEFIQVGTWGYDTEKILQAHIHNEVSRHVPWTQEAIFVRAGALRASIYGTDQKLLQEIVLEAGDLIVLLRGGHGYEILEDGTQVLEIKNGPYVGAEADRRRFT